MQLMDVVTAYVYLYGSLDLDIYMKVPDGIFIMDSHTNRNMYCVKLTKSLYGLKQSGTNVVQPVEGVPFKQMIL